MQNSYLDHSLRNKAHDSRMTQDDLVKDLSPKMGSIGESHQAPTIDAYGTYQSQMESRHRSSIEREIE